MDSCLGSVTVNPVSRQDWRTAAFAAPVSSLIMAHIDSNPARILPMRGCARRQPTTEFVSKLVAKEPNRLEANKQNFRSAESEIRATPQNSATQPQAPQDRSSRSHECGYRRCLSASPSQSHPTVIRDDRAALAAAPHMPCSAKQPRSHRQPNAKTNWCFGRFDIALIAHIASKPPTKEPPAAVQPGSNGADPRTLVLETSTRDERRLALVSIWKLANDLRVSIRTTWRRMTAESALQVFLRTASQRIH